MDGGVAGGGVGVLFAPGWGREVRVGVGGSVVMRLKRSLRVEASRCFYCGAGQRAELDQVMT